MRRARRRKYGWPSCTWERRRKRPSRSTRVSLIRRFEYAAETVIQTVTLTATVPLGASVRWLYEHVITIGQAVTIDLHQGGNLVNITVTQSGHRSAATTPLSSRSLSVVWWRTSGSVSCPPVLCLDTSCKGPRPASFRSGPVQTSCDSLWCRALTFRNCERPVSSSAMPSNPPRPYQWQECRLRNTLHGQLPFNLRGAESFGLLVFHKLDDFICFHRSRLLFLMYLWYTLWYTLSSFFITDSWLWYTS